jgi:hypothetical protein
MNSCKLQGGLGNQLFQIFTTIAYALTLSQPFFFLNNHQLGTGANGETIRYTYWETFLSGLKPFLKKLEEVPNLLYIKEKSFKYQKLPESFEKNYGILLVGYFQSPKYFDKYKNIIYKFIKIDIKKLIVKTKTAINFEVNPHISMHFRLGDYKKYPHIYPILSKKYYSNSISYILEKLTNKPTKVLYFCEDGDLAEVIKTINILEKEFPFLSFSRANPLLEDWEQLLLMSLCEYNIIANSTFSWWGGYLNDNPNKIVCYPEQWFQPETNHDTSDLFPEDWVPIPLS